MNTETAHCDACLVFLACAFSTIESSSSFSTSANLLFFLDLSSSVSVFQLSFLEFGSKFLLCRKSTSKPDNMSKFGKFSSRSSAIIEKSPAGEQREFTGTIVHRFGNSIDQSERA